MGGCLREERDRDRSHGDDVKEGDCSGGWG